ncbi:hypothetical protein [Photobacterium leiognathi]|uniref:hypothetical protein n=1 Tax=Photobacterium leiognathi TaxID=553611 RepID=UPI0029813115|nr:hypothetical protein [Photobacterium leiognathi]
MSNSALIALLSLLNKTWVLSIAIMGAILFYYWKMPVFELSVLEAMKYSFSGVLMFGVVFVLGKLIHLPIIAPLTAMIAMTAYSSFDLLQAMDIQSHYTSTFAQLIIYFSIISFGLAFHLLFKKD